MKVQVVSFRCVLKNKLGRVISSTYNREILTGGTHQGESLPGLTKRMQNLKQGERRLIHLTASEAYGFYDPKMVLRVPKSDLPDPTSRSPIPLMMNGEERSFRIVGMSGDSVLLDGNHPLAGQDLTFEIETVAVRDATPQEIADSEMAPEGGLLH